MEKKQTNCIVAGATSVLAAIGGAALMATGVGLAPGGVLLSAGISGTINSIQ